MGIIYPGDGMGETGNGMLCRCCRHPGVKGCGRTLFYQGMPLCDRCYIKLLSRGQGGAPPGEGR